MVNTDASTLVEWRKSTGIGKLIRDLGDNKGIEYVVLQDHKGILAANSTVSEMSSPDSDPQLARALERDTIFSRTTQFQGRQVYEAVKSFSLDATTIGVFRLGLSMEQIRSTEARMYRRIAVMSVVLIAVGGLIVTLVMARQNYRLLFDRFRSFQTFTGNVLEQMRDAVVTINDRNVITLFNKQAEALFGIQATEAIDRPLDDLPHPVGPCLRDLFTSQQNHQELTIHCNHDTRVVSVTISSTFQRDGTLESRTAVIRDLTEAKRLEQEIQRKEKLSAMGELAAGIAHEIRNPLNAIVMIAQRYEREFTPRSDVQEYRTLTSVLLSEARRVNNIIQQFLRFARPPQVRPTPVSAREFVDRVAILVKPQADEQGVVFSTTCDVAGAITIDPEQMMQALLNVLQNALDATPRGGSITLGLEFRQPNLVFIVRDTGSGIPPEKLDKIFNLYFTSKPDGTGMGLAITQQIISQHNGFIEVNSELGKGTEFRLYIPQ